MPVSMHYMGAAIVAAASLLLCAPVAQAQTWPSVTVDASTYLPGDTVMVTWADIESPTPTD